MKTCLVVVILCVCFVTVWSECKWQTRVARKKDRGFTKYEPTNLNTLRMVHAIFRHGDRTPDVTLSYPNDPYYNDTYYPVGHGELTKLGKKQEYQIGKDLRKRYDKFLGDIYVPNVLEARSTDYNRTKASLMLVLAGLYPPTEEQIWNPDLLWQPIPYSYWKRSEDIILDPVDACPKLMSAYNDYLLSDEFLQNNEQLKEFYEYISEYVGVNVTTPSEVYDIYFTLFAEEDLGLPLPKWTDCVWPYMITNVATKYYNLLTKTPEMRQYAIGLFFKKMLEDSRSFISGKMDQQRKLFLYSAHENNIAFTLIGLNVFKPHVPSYASYILMELHEINGEYGFKILYRDSQNTEPYLLQIPGCDTFCPIDKFVELLKENIPETYDC